MRFLKLMMASSILMVAFSVASAPVVAQDNQEEENTGQTTLVATEDCQVGSFFGLPAWYKYLEYGQEADGEGNLKTDPLTGAPDCGVRISGIADVWFIVAAVLEILLRLAALIAVGVVIFGGFSYVTSQGNPDKTKQALQTLVGAIIGLTISVTAAAVVSFIAGRFN